MVLTLFFSWKGEDEGGGMNWKQLILCFVLQILKRQQCFNS